MAATPALVASNLTEMAKALAKSKDSVLVEEFLYSLLTTSEIDEIATGVPGPRKQRGEPTRVCPGAYFYSLADRLQYVSI